MYNNLFNVVIPMAGEGSRFGGKFKPFLKLDSRLFIEHVIESFKSISVDMFYFIMTKEQLEKYNVIEKVKEIFPENHNKIKVISIEKKTNGPFETIKEGLNLINDKLENTIFCDCDHFVNIENFKKNLSFDVIIPAWNIDKDNQENWGKVVTSQDDKIIKICEKEIVEKSSEIKIRGMIGCFFFKDSDLVKQNTDKITHFSEFLNLYHEKLKVKILDIDNAYFFGTPAMAKEAIKTRRKYQTIFLDFDGVLVEHKNHSNDLVKDNNLIGECSTKIKNLRLKNNKIVITTARPDKTKESFLNLLKSLEIEYDDVLMGLNPGPRYLVNDIKPTNIHVRQAIAFNVERNNGIQELNFSENKNFDIEVLANFKGNSFSKTSLLKKDNKLFVRKFIEKKDSTKDHYDKLKRQFDDLKRFSFYNKKLVPNIIQEKDFDHCYYFDIEYMKDYNQLDEFEKDIQDKVLKKVILDLKDNVYCFKKKNNSNKFIEDFFNTKIYSKLDLFEKQLPEFDHLINSKEINVNNRKMLGLREVLKEINISDFNTEYINPIHGDLTLENILYNHSKNDYKLIDMDGSRYVDSCYFDLGKIFQSIVSNYKEWNRLNDIVDYTDLNNIKCCDNYFSCKKEDFKDISTQYASIMKVNNWEIVFKKGIFYMAMYFIRFVPFRMKISKNHGIFALIMAINWLNYLIRIKTKEEK